MAAEDADGTGDGAGGGAPRSNFVREIVERDLAEGRRRHVVTRFPPEPNGFLHIGHAKSICLNFGIAREFGGRCNLRFDDTNPLKEESRYVRAIEEDVRWLGFEWGETLFASDYFERMYDCAELLIRKGRAYVDSQTQEEIGAQRGTVTESGRDSPHRKRSPEESLDLFRRMRAGEFEDGAHVLRARIDMSHPNMLLRDPLLYRIRHARHFRQGDAWCIYPMYDYAHPLEDAFEGVTHSLCTLEFENNRPLYDWVVRETEVACRPQQIEFARLALSSTVLSKRYLLQLVEGGHVAGWDDPRMPTLAGLRRRGCPPAAIRALCELVGVAKANSTVDLGKLDFCLREELNPTAPRVMCVLRPLEVVLENWPAGHVEWIDAPHWPADVPREGSRGVPCSGRLLIEREDFAEEPPPGWHRLAPGGEVRLRHGYVIRCDSVERNEAGDVVRLRCSYDPDTLGRAPAGRKVRGAIHWVSADHALPCEVRLYDRLFSVERPGADPVRSFLEELDPESLVVLRDARVEPSVAEAPEGTRFQFERQGYFASDPVDTRPGAPVFNRIVTLKDSWARISREEAPEEPTLDEPTAGAPRERPSRERSNERDAARAADPRLADAHTRYLELGLEPGDADLLSGDLALAEWFEAAVRRHPNAPLVAKWLVNELLRERKDRALAALPVRPEQLGALVELVDRGSISATAGKEVFAVMARDGRDPGEIVLERGLTQVSDEQQLEPAVAAVVNAHPDEVRRYQAGKTQLLGFFVGKVLKATGGRANPQLVRELVERRLA